MAGVPVIRANIIPCNLSVKIILDLLNSSSFVSNNFSLVFGVMIFHVASTVSLSLTVYLSCTAFKIAPFFFCSIISWSARIKVDTATSALWTQSTDNDITMSGTKVKETF